MRVIFHFFLFLPLVTEALNVLIYSAPIGFSHIQLMTSIADTLVEAGHNVTVLAPVVEPKMRKHASKGATTVFVDMPEEIREKQNARTEGLWQLGPMFGNVFKVGGVASIQLDVCKYLLDRRADYFHLLNTTFDVAVVDLNGMCGFGFTKILDVRNSVAVSAIGFMDGVTEVFHTPVMHSYVPGQLLYFTDRMTFLQRMWNGVWHTFSQTSYSLMYNWRYKQLFASYGVHFDLLGSILPDINFLLINTDEYLDIGRPVSQRIKYIGGVAVKPPGKMPIDFERLLSSSNKGAIAISFGSYATTSDMPKEMKDAFLLAIDELPEYDFIWRVDHKDLELSKGRKNLHTVQWLPQRELLHHEKVKVFVSHAGMNSVLETTRAGKPALFIPIFGDQFQNAAMVSRKNSSKIIWKTDLKGLAVVDALKSLLEDEGLIGQALGSLAEDFCLEEPITLSVPAETPFEYRLEEEEQPALQLHLLASYEQQEQPVNLEEKHSGLPASDQEEMTVPLQAAHVEDSQEHYESDDWRYQVATGAITQEEFLSSFNEAAEDSDNEDYSIDALLVRSKQGKKPACIHRMKDLCYRYCHARDNKNGTTAFHCVSCKDLGETVSFFPVYCASEPLIEEWVNRIRALTYFPNDQELLELTGLMKVPVKTKHEAYMAFKNFLTYFQNTWMEGPFKGKWMKFLQETNRTSNIAESFHSYFQRAQRLGEMMRSKRFSPRERILEAVEYSGKFGRIHDLDVAGFQMGIMEYFNIDVIIGWAFIVSLFFYAIYSLFSWFRGGKKVKFD